MEFGRIPEEELNNIDFSLPAEPSFNKTVLSNKKYENAKYMWAAQNGDDLNG